jgi:hypothetical protein
VKRRSRRVARKIKDRSLSLCKCHGVDASTPTSTRRQACPGFEERRGVLSVVVAVEVWRKKLEEAGGREKEKVPSSSCFLPHL